MNWIYICTAIVKYAEYIRNSNIDISTLKSLSLKTVINSVYSKDIMFAEYLNDYITWRKNLRIESDSRSDYVGEIEVSTDNKYILDYKM